MLDIPAAVSLFNCLNNRYLQVRNCSVFLTVFPFCGLVNSIKDQTTSQQLISRKALATRWQCTPETIKRRTREGLLHPVRFNQRNLRYRLSEIIQVEDSATEVRV